MRHRLNVPGHAPAWQQPRERVTATADLGEQGHLGLLGPVGPGLLGLLDEGLVVEDGLALVAPDRDDEHAEEDGLEDEYDTVEDAGLLDEDVLGAVRTRRIPAHCHQGHRVGRQQAHVEEELQKVSEKETAYSFTFCFGEIVNLEKRDIFCNGKRKAA